MKTSEAERTSGDLPAADGVTINEASHLPMQTRPAAISAATVQAPPTAIRKKPTANSRADWPLPPPISSCDTATEGNTEAPAPKQHPRNRLPHNTVNLATRDLETLTALQTRCKDMGVKVRKNQLLAISLQLLANAPTGKLLAMLGPLECYDSVPKRKKKKSSPGI